MINDYYLTSGPKGEPLENIQMLGKIAGPVLQSCLPLPGLVARWLARHSVDISAMSADRPTPQNRVTLRNGQIVLDWKGSNGDAHLALVAKLKRKLRQAGFPIVLARPFDRRNPSHQCGTARMGSDPNSSVVDPFCRNHNHSNLFTTDASVLPTSAAVNPALTIAALSLRATDHMQRSDLLG